MTVDGDADSVVHSVWTLMTSEPTRMLRAAVAILGAALAIPALAQDTVTGTRRTAAIGTEALVKDLANPVVALRADRPERAEPAADLLTVS